MLGGLMGKVPLGKRALKTSRKDTKSGFSVGGRKRGSRAPLSAAQEAHLEHLRRLAPRPGRIKKKPRPSQPKK